MISLTYSFASKNFSMDEKLIELFDSEFVGFIIMMHHKYQNIQQNL